MTYINPKILSLDEDNQKTEKRYNEDLTINDYSSLDLVYFAFIDVLGFKKTFDDNRNSGSEFTNAYRKVFNYYFELMDAAKFMDEYNRKSTGCYAGQTSDSLYFYTCRPDILVEFIKIFSYFNLYAMTENVFFRGGIAKGKLFKKADYQFYGDSVIYAYLLESLISKNPIIVIDDKTFKDIREINDCNVLINNNLDRCFIKPFALLNKIKNSSIKFDINYDKIVEFKKIDEDKIITNINSNISLFEYDGKNFEKYMFLKKEYEQTKNS